MLKKMDGDTRKSTDGESDLALQEATALSEDLEMEEQRGSMNHKVSTILNVKVPRVTKKR
jgi:hypothetical protein